MATRIVVIACEGAHELLFVPRLLQTLGWIRASITHDDPDVIGRLVPRPIAGTSTQLLQRMEPAPVFMKRGGAWVVISRFGGISRLLGPELREFAKQVGSSLVTLAVIVDADDRTADDRRAALEHHLAPWWRGRVVPGAFVATAGVRVGLWVWPDNAATGTFDDLLSVAAREGRSTLFHAASQLVEGNAEFLEMSDGDRIKATLGILGQADAPAANLPASLKLWDGWRAGAPSHGPFREFCSFLGGLVLDP